MPRERKMRLKLFDRILGAGHPHGGVFVLARVSSLSGFAFLLVAAMPAAAVEQNLIRDCLNETMPVQQRVESCTRLIDDVPDEQRGNACLVRGYACLDGRDLRHAIARGYAKHDEGGYDGAIADYVEALRIDGSDPETFYSRGLSYQQKGDLDRAIADYTASIRLDPAHANALHNRAVAFRKKRDVKHAPDDAGAYERLTQGRK
ncbi:MAG: tetratricopeptide repeat protein [Phyllobacterium sp.]